MTVERIDRRQQDYLVPIGMSTPTIVSGSGAEVTDDRGRRYVDLEAGPGVASVGHAHPKVAAAVAEQATTLLQGPGRYFTDGLLRLAARLAGVTGGRLPRTLIANSGAEANEAAIKLTLKHAIKRGKQGLGIIALEHGFHGRLSLPLALTGMAQRKRGMGPFPTFPGIVHAPAPYCYRCPLRLSYPSCDIACADVITDKLATAVPGEAAVMIGEPILGVGGIIVPPDEYWPRVERICRDNEITLIHDEVFTGFGRTGRMFGHDLWDVEPDVVTFGKAIGGGVPLAGLLASDEVADAFEPGDHFTTFGPNNQVGLRAASAVLDVLKEEGLPQRAERLGLRLMDGLRSVSGQHAAVGDVRGRGLMVGVEIVANEETKEPDAVAAQAMRETMLDQGFLIGVTGVFNNILRITPPLVISERQIDDVLEALDAALRHTKA